LIAAESIWPDCKTGIIMHRCARLKRLGANLSGCMQMSKEKGRFIQSLQIRYGLF
jgi:hypothetical protein